MKNVVSPFKSEFITLLKCLFVDCKLYKFPSKNDKNKHLEMTPWSQTWGSSKLKYLNKTLFYRTVPGGKPIYHFPAAQKDIIFFVKYEQRNFCLWITNMELIFFIIYKLNLKGTFLIYNSTQLTFYWSSRVDNSVCLSLKLCSNRRKTGVYSVRSCQLYISSKDPNILCSQNSNVNIYFLRRKESKI